MLLVCYADLKLTNNMLLVYAAMRRRKTKSQGWWERKIQGEAACTKEGMQRS
jgi:hypothetical protein